jgi:hypothetical protein
VTALSWALNTDLRLLTQSGGDLVQYYHPEGHSTWLVSQYTTVKKKIDQFVKNDNADAKPFPWTPTADSIMANIKHL